MRILKGAIICLVLGTTSAAFAQLQSAYHETIRGDVLMIGNTLGLDGLEKENEPGTFGSVQSFIDRFDTDGQNDDGQDWPDNFVTSDWEDTAAGAEVAIPAGATISKAWLLWAGSCLAGDRDGIINPTWDENIIASVGDSVTLVQYNGASVVAQQDVAPADNFRVRCDSATQGSVDEDLVNGYTNVADVTAFIAANGAGFYAARGVPATQYEGDNPFGTFRDDPEPNNFGGWTLVIVYEDASMPLRDVSVSFGMDLGEGGNSPPSDFGDICVPEGVSDAGRLLVTAGEGDAGADGDRLRFGPVGSLTNMQGPSHPATNFFASQLTDETGAYFPASFDTRVTVDNIDVGGNHNPDGTLVAGARQGWDIAAVPVNDSGAACGAGACNAGVLPIGTETARLRVHGGNEEVFLHAAALSLPAVDFDTDVNNCGACAMVCDLNNVDVHSCSGGICEVGTCDAGFLDLDGNDANGCEASGCPVGTADCDSNPSDCETDIDFDADNCGGCGIVCSIANASAVGCATGTCVVTDCDNGYQASAAMDACVDIDECSDSALNNCDPNATCANTDGDFTCTCNAGFSGDGITCAPDATCGDNNIDAGEDCDGDTLPSGTACPAGYTGSPLCENAPGNTDGDGTCTLAAIPDGCTNIDECTGDPCDTNAACTDTEGSFECVCNAGYSGDGINCADDNECAGEGTGNNCDSNASCTNTDGGFECACNTGYNGDGILCVDIDECRDAADNNCDSNASCSNTDGGFDCTCNTGYSGDGTSCVNDDECAGEGSGNNCDSNATCTDTEGSFDCTCNAGYSGDGTSCVNDDECAGEGSGNNCDTNATCTDTEGSFDCTCNAGFNGDGVTCAPDSACGDGVIDPGETCDGTAIDGALCPDGYTGTPLCNNDAANSDGDGSCTLDVVPDGCENIDECADSALNNCDVNAFCTDTEGSYDCTCNLNFNGDGFLCVDIDECLNPGDNECDSNATCTNTPGSHECECNMGYTGDGSSCDDIDECSNLSTNGCDANATCTNTDGGYDCACNDGFAGDGFTCVDTNLCGNGTLDAGEDCDGTALAAGSEACPAGFTGTPLCNNDSANTDGDGSCTLDGVPDGCADSDECAGEGGGNNCDTNATCANIPGSFDCTCNSGFTGDGVTCIEAPTGCGNGDLDVGETCDDGNLESDDGCSGFCQIEEGWECTGAPSLCAPVCGDEIVVGSEGCDDGGFDDGDGCGGDCQVEPGWECDDNRIGPTQCEQVSAPGCGDSVIGVGETCDDGNISTDDGCTAFCQIELGWVCDNSSGTSSCATICGDDIVVGAEGCDDGQNGDGDGCSDNCAVEAGWTCDGSRIGASMCEPLCGDGVLTADEVCDDGDVASGDGCSNLCEIETGWSCDDVAPSTCGTDCGDGLIRGTEECDDDNTVAGDGCSAACEFEAGACCDGGEPTVCGDCLLCGNGTLDSGEACDDGNDSAGDGCSAFCIIEPDYECSGEPSDCVIADPVCGNGRIEAGEACDDSNSDSDDGCSADCVVEDGWACVLEPSECSPLAGDDCGDGSLDDGESCDDGDRSGGDGCSAACVVEAGWTCSGEPSDCERVNAFGEAVATGGTLFGCASTDRGARLGGVLLALVLVVRIRRKP